MSKLRENYFLSSSIEGQKDEISLTVRMLKPTSLAQAMEVARLQEQLSDYKFAVSYFRFARSFSNNPTINNFTQNQFSKPYQSNKSPVG